MGWLITSGTTKQDIVNEITSNKDVLDYSVVGNDLWVLYQYEGEKHLDLYMLRSERGYGWGYKGVSVVYGPYRHTAPARLVKAMSTLNDTNDASGWGRDWLTKWIAYQEEKKNRRKYSWQPGDKVKLWDDNVYTLLRKKTNVSWLVQSDNGMVYQVTTRNMNKHGEKTE